MRTSKNKKQFKTRNITDDSLNYLNDDNKTQGGDVVRETQSDIDNLYNSIKNSPTGFFGKKFYVERYEIH